MGAAASTARLNRRFTRGFSSTAPSRLIGARHARTGAYDPAALPADWRDILALTKPRVMSLVVFTGLAACSRRRSCRRW